MSIWILQRNPATVEPVVDHICATKTVIKLIGLPCFYNGGPTQCRSRAVIRMDKRTPVLQLIKSLAKIFRHLPADELNFTFCSHRPHETRNRVVRQTQIALARAKRILGAHSIVDVSQKHVPSGDVAFRISRRISARLEPSVNTVCPPLAKYDGIRLSRFYRPFPGVDYARKVIRVHGVTHGPILKIFERLPEIFQDLSVEEFNFSGGIQRAHKSRDGVDDSTKPLFTLLKRRLVAPSIFNVGIRSEPFDNPSVAVVRRDRTEKKPTKHAIETAQSSFNFARLARRQGGLPVINEPIQIFRVQCNCPAPVKSLRGGQTGIVEPSLIKEV